MANDGASLCYILVIIVSIGFLIWGFMDLLKRKQANERTTNDVISRQIRGFAFIMISQVILVLGTILCLGANGGLKGLGAQLRSLQKGVM